MLDEDLKETITVTFHSDSIVPIGRDGGGSILIWGCISSADIGEYFFLDGIKNASVFSEILYAKMIPSLKTLGRRGLFQHNNKQIRGFKMNGATWHHLT